MPSFIYKCRADFASDVDDLIRWHQEKGDSRVTINTIDTTRDHILGDGTWTFESNLSHPQLTAYFMSCPLPDIHYIYQSVKMLDQYDGERDQPYPKLYKRQRGRPQQYA